MLLNKTLFMLNILGGSEMYVPKPGVNDFSKDVESITTGASKSITLDGDFVLHSASRDGDTSDQFTITYPSGDKFTFNSGTENNPNYLDIFLPKNTVISCTLSHLHVKGYYVVPVSSVM